MTCNDHLLRAAAGPVDEVEDAVDAPVGAAAGALLGLGLQEGDGPELKLEGVLLPEGAGAARVHGFAEDLVVSAGEEVEGGLEAGLHEGDGEVGNVNAQPAALELFGGGHGGAAAAEGVQDHVAGVGGGEDDAFQEGPGASGWGSRGVPWHGNLWG